MRQGTTYSAQPPPKTPRDKLSPPPNSQQLSNFTLIESPYLGFGCVEIPYVCCRVGNSILVPARKGCDKSGLSGGVSNVNESLCKYVCIIIVCSVQYHSA